MLHIMDLEFKSAFLFYCICKHDSSMGSCQKIIFGIVLARWASDTQPTLPCFCVCDARISTYNDYIKLRLFISNSIQQDKIADSLKP